jgi:hypothetical protein
MLVPGDNRPLGAHLPIFSEKAIGYSSRLFDVSFSAVPIC